MGIGLNVNFPDEARFIVRDVANDLNISPAQFLRNLVCTELVKHAKTEMQRKSLLRAIKTNSE